MFGHEQVKREKTTRKSTQCLVTYQTKYYSECFDLVCVNKKKETKA